MNRYIEKLTEHYSEQNHYMKKKAEYTAILVCMIIVTMLTIMAIEIAIVGYTLPKLLSMLVFVVAFFFLMFLIRIKLLEEAVNCLIIAGFIRELMVYFYETPFQFYAMTFLIVLTAAVVHVKKHQLFAAYTITGALLVYKVFQYHQMYVLDSSLLRTYTQTIYTVIIYIVFVFMIHFLVDIIHREINESQQLKTMANTDTLTGIYNRRCFDELVNEYMNDYISLSVILLDLDYFKSINDKYGHNTGDRVLVEVTQLLKNHTEDGDLFRWGGEEFLILLPDYNLEESRLIAETLRRTIMHSEIVVKEKLTASFGVAEYRGKETPEALIHRADNALYASKKHGRNKVSVA